MEMQEIINLIRLPQVEKMTGYGRSSIYRLVKEGKFPAPISPVVEGGRASAWIEGEVVAWINQRIEQSRNKSQAHGEYK